MDKQYEPAVIVDRYINDGDSLEEIARDYDVNRTTIKRRLEKHGIQLRKRGPYVGRVSKAPATPKQKAQSMKYLYKITPEDYSRMYAEQNGACAICETAIPAKWEKGVHIDHCHETHIVRGLLCPNCNMALGMLNDDPDRMRKCIAYLLES